MKEEEDDDDEVDETAFGLGRDTFAGDDSSAILLDVDPLLPPIDIEPS